MKSRRHFLTLALALAAFQASAATTNEFILVQRGDLPIIITAPHGGSMAIPDVPKRVGPEGERKNGKFVTSQDTRTFELATATAKQLESLTGKKPFVVVMKAHRQFVDANRPEAEGVEHASAKAVHAAFHATLRELVDDLRVRFPRGALLLDIHGQAASSNTIYRGTQNGTTVMRLIEKHGAGALTGEHSVLGTLAARGLEVSPANTPPGDPPEHRSYNGGYIVRTYGSHRTNGVDAIQLEFGSAFRVNEKKREETAKSLAEAIKAFHQRYLSEPK